MRRTVLYDCHLEGGGRLVDFAGWQMPVQYPTGIIREHLQTRRSAGLFDISHMGRFEISGRRAVEFLRGVLTHDAGLLAMGQAHYTLLANPAGGAIDDAFLYRFQENSWLLVVNAANAYKDWDHLARQAEVLGGVQLKDVSGDMAMMALQGPRSQEILEGLLGGGQLPETKRNALSQAAIAGAEMRIGRTGYTGEPVCFELFMPAQSSAKIWRLLREKGAQPVGLGARDTLRLEASLPLYGHEYGKDFEGREIPILACPTARFGVDLSDPQRRFIGREAIERQWAGVSRRICAVRITGKGIGREGAAIYSGGREVGRLTSGTMVPYWVFQAPTCPRQCGHGPRWEDHFTEQTAQRAVALAMIDGQIGPGTAIEVESRGRRLEAIVVKRNLDNRGGPFTLAVI